MTLDRAHAFRDVSSPDKWLNFGDFGAMVQFVMLKGHLFRLPYGSDLLEALTEELKRRGIRAGFLSVMGAVKEATLLYYDQGKRAYRSRRIKGGLEIASTVGNISLREGEVFVHLHAVLADEEGRTWGGHLGSPTEVFAVEAFVLELQGEPPERSYDPLTGLYLWR